jgi:hypothetical protein
MLTIDKALLDQLSELEVQALLEGLKDECLRTKPPFLAVVRKFMNDNVLLTQPEEVQKVASKVREEEIPDLYVV